MVYRLQTERLAVRDRNNKKQSEHMVASQSTCGQYICTHMHPITGACECSSCEANYMYGEIKSLLQLQMVHYYMYLYLNKG